jgi:hypothetical protein
MKVKYLMLSPKMGLEKNTESAQKLMTTFEISGVFSEALLTKVFDILIKTIDALENGNIDIALKTGMEFNTILDTYLIFSEDFKIETKRLMGAVLL